VRCSTTCGTQDNLQHRLFHSFCLRGLSHWLTLVRLTDTPTAATTTTTTWQSQHAQALRPWRTCSSTMTTLSTARPATSSQSTLQGRRSSVRTPMHQLAMATLMCLERHSRCSYLPAAATLLVLALLVGLLRSHLALAASTLRLHSTSALRAVCVHQLQVQLLLAHHNGVSFTQCCGSVCVMCGPAA
jgi:hypothetical protein